MDLETNIRNLRESVTEVGQLDQIGRRNRTLIEAIPQFVWTSDADGNTDYVSEQWEGYTGQSSKECFGAQWSAFIHPDDAARTAESWQTSVRTGVPYQCEHRIRGQAGQYRWFISRAVPVREQDGTIRWIGTSTDIQDQKDLQDRLRESEQRYRALFDNMTEGFILGEMISDENGKPVDARLIAVNPWMVRSGLVPGDAIGKSWCELSLGLDNGIYETLGRVAATGEPAQFEALNRDLERHYECYGYSPAPGQFAATFRDVTIQKRIEQVLRETEERLQLAIDATQFGLFDFDPQTGKLLWSEFARRQFGVSPAANVDYETFLRGLHPEDRDRVDQIVKHALRPESGGVYVAEYRTIGIDDGKERWLSVGGRVFFDSQGRPVRFIGGGVDITERKQFDEKLRQMEKQKMESIGLLTSGIAHDFNNLMGGILASAELAQAERAEGSSVDEELLRIRHAAVRGGEIVRQLMTYGGGESPVFEPVDLSLLVGEMLELLKVSISKHVILDTDLGHDLPAVYANPSQIRQVVMNLATNASEAIGERDGVIRVTTERIRVGLDARVPGTTTSPGYYLKLEVSDTGNGMTPKVQTRIFDPFFTTKRTGRGLGLAAVQGIVRSHFGAINVVSSLGQGTRFEILLPCTDQPVQPIRDTVVQAAVGDVPSVTATVLLIEDEDTLRQAVAKMLRKKGLPVIEAVDGNSAVDLFRVNEPGIAVVLLDMTLPGMSGPEVFAELRRIRPDVKVILTSAYGQEFVDASFSGLRVEHFIRKPYQLNDLVRVIWDVCLQEGRMSRHSAS